MNEMSRTVPTHADILAPLVCQTVLIACADTEHERIGRTFLANVIRKHYHCQEQQVGVWKLERFGSPIARMLATLDFLDANLIMVVATALQALSVGTRVWISEWPARRHSGHGMLVAILSGTSQEAVSAWPDQCFLRQAADRCNMQYMAYAGDPPDSEISSLSA